MLKSSDTVRDLIAARDRIDTPEKWCKHALHKNHNRAHCAIGAVFIATTTNGYGNYDTPPLRALGAAAVRLYPERNTGFNTAEPEWALANVNNHPDTTHADVMRVFDEAIATAE